MTVNNTDLFLVERSGTSYKLEAQNLVAELQDTDLMLVERSGTSYKATGSVIKDSLGGGSLPSFNIDDCFTCFEFTGNGTSKTFNLGLDLLNDGGMVWIRNPTGGDHYVFTTATGNNKTLRLNNNLAPGTESNSLTFTNTGFTLGSNSLFNPNNGVRAVMVWKCHTGFFDLVTYTGSGSAKTVSHSLGAAPRMVWVKNIESGGNWAWYIESEGSNGFSEGNVNNNTQSNQTVWDQKCPNTTSFFLDGTYAFSNQSNQDYLAFVFGGSYDPGYPVRFGTYWGDDTVPFEVPSFGDSKKPQFILGKCTAAQFGYSSHAAFAIDKATGMPGFTNSGSRSYIWRFNASVITLGSSGLTYGTDVFRINKSDAVISKDSHKYMYMAYRED